MRGGYEHLQPVWLQRPLPHSPRRALVPGLRPQRHQVLQRALRTCLCHQTQQQPGRGPQSHPQQLLLRMHPQQGLQTQWKLPQSKGII